LELLLVLLLEQEQQSELPSGSLFYVWSLLLVEQLLLHININKKLNRKCILIQHTKAKLKYLLV